MIYRFDNPVCLNGWWDFLPVYEQPVRQIAPPASGWLSEAFLVPSYYNKPATAIRMPGEKYYSYNKKEVSNPEADNLFDNFDYPAQWSTAKAAWVGRNLDIEFTQGKRFILSAEAIGPKTTLFINGVQVGSPYMENTLPYEIDITGSLKNGSNRIDFFIEDYDRNELGKAMWPSGNRFTDEMRGIWQNIWLVEKNEVYIDDLTIVTSVRSNTLNLKYDVVNKSGKKETAILIPKVFDGSYEVLSSSCNITIEANSIASVSLEIFWDNAKLWDTFNPNLYWIKTALLIDGAEVDFMTERFGFREVWIENENLMLNNAPIHLFSDWGHKVTAFHHTQEWNKKWFGMLRDYNMNHSRLSTHPHPRLVMDLADEEGIYITAETALMGSGATQAASSSVYWENAQKHVERFVRREKNHPSVLLWSCGNEMRWNGNEGIDMIKTELPKIKTLFNKLDPTRPAYFEGDTTLWNEKPQDIISRHYGKECSGIGWWNKKQPLHSGEICVYHYEQPNVTMNLGGDLVWGSYENCHTAGSLDLCYTIEDARANGVCCLGVWNFSGIANLRKHKEKHFEYTDFTAPGAKPLIAKDGSSEFVYWEDGSGYISQPGTELCVNAFRPFAVFDLSRRLSFYADKEIKKHFYLVNDTAAVIEGTLTVTLSSGGKVVSKTEIKNIKIKRGRITEADLSLDASNTEGKCEYSVQFISSDKNTLLDKWTREIILSLPQAPVISGKIAVYGNGDMKALFTSAGFNYSYINDLSKIGDTSILILEKNTVTPGSDMPEHIRRFLQAGGKVIVMEQYASVFSEFTIEDKSVQTAFIRGYENDVVSSFTEAELSFWSDTPYTSTSGGASVASKLYVKDNGEAMRFLIDSDEGDFGSEGDLKYTALFSIVEGKGIIYACQMEISAAYQKVPAALKLFYNILKAADTYVPPKNEEQVTLVKSNTEINDALTCAFNGGSAIIFNIDPQMAKIISKTTGVEINLEKEELGTWNAIRSSADKYLAGVSNNDLCGIEKFSYVSGNLENMRIAEYVIKPGAGMKTLIETVSENYMVPFFVYKSMSLLRSYNLSKYCYSEKQPHYSLLVEIAHGKGRVFASTLNLPKDKRDRFARLENQLIQNITGLPVSKSAFMGNTVPENKMLSKGYPEVIYTWNGELTQAVKDFMMESCIYQYERIESSPIFSLGNFKKFENENGIFSAENFDLSHDIVLYYTVKSSKPRKTIKSVIEMPDPLAQTFLEVLGQGNVSIWLNSKYCGETELDGIYPDLELEAGINHLLLTWHPIDRKSSISMRWKNVLKQSETSLIFYKRWYENEQW